MGLKNDARAAGGQAVRQGKRVARKFAKNGSRIVHNAVSNPSGFFDDILGFGQLRQVPGHVGGIWDAYKGQRAMPTADKARIAAGKTGQSVWESIKGVNKGYSYENAIGKSWNWLTAAGHSGWGRAGRAGARGLALMGAMKAIDWLNPFSD
jgi:hypothetical protein